MQDTQLQKLVEQVSLEHFKREFVHKAIWNSQLRTTGGRYHLQTHNLDFNLKVYHMYGKEELIKVIKHELCHYHLHILGKGYQHRDKDFKELLKNVGGVRYVQSLSSTTTEMKKWQYTCTKCAQHYERKRRFDTARYVCGRCKGQLVLTGKKR